MWIADLIIDDEREEHIARYHVTIEEAEDIVFGNPFITRVREWRYRLIGRAASGRYLTVIIGSRGNGEYGLITARDSDDVERRLYRRHRRN